MVCTTHRDFFDDACPECRQEYLEMKGANDVSREPAYKEFTEERAKKLYEEVMLQYLKAGADELEAAGKARAVVRKQCAIRNMPFWPWL
ncbi:hypothetical protein [Nitrososphaera sp.]|uniref:hypothetical protein n=1 Tax=Nitrososphaera sp. TaxID=1971748 RepID=UPI00307FC538